MNKVIYTLKSILDKPQIIFVIISLFIGSLLVFIVPPEEIPDENRHVFRACETAAGIFYNKKPAEETKYEQAISPVLLTKKLPYKFHNASGYSSIMYLGSALGVKLGYHLTHNAKIMFYSGRLFNLFLYTLLIFLAIRITPVFKYPFMFCALLPTMMVQAMSFNADSFNNGFAFLFFAFIFKLIFDKKEMTKKDLTILSVFSIIGALCKGVIYPLGLFFFLPKPSTNLRFKNKYFYIISLIIFTLLICYWYDSINYAPIRENITLPDKYILFKNPLNVVLRIIITTIVKFKFFIFHNVAIVGWYLEKLYLPLWSYYTTILCFLSMFFVLPEKINFKIKCTAFIIFIIAYSGVLYRLLITYTGNNSLLIEGLQGRYFLPMLPLLFIVFSNHICKFTDKIKTIYKTLLTTFIFFVLIVFVYNLYNLFVIEHFRSIIYLQEFSDFYFK